MKVLVILGLFFACTQAEDLMKKAHDAIPVCAQETGANVEEIKETMKETTLPVDDAEFTKFFTCYYTKIGLLKDDGEIDTEKIETSFPYLLKQKYGEDNAEQLAKDAIKHCEDANKGSTGVVGAIKLRNCALEYVKEHHK